MWVGFRTSIATNFAMVSMLFSNELAVMTGITLYATVLKKLTLSLGI